MFEENSAGHFDAKIYSAISIKFALRKYVLTFFVPSKYFLFCAAYSHSVSVDPRLSGCNGKIY